jgi:molybdopterin-biosynthesis enzyme MoeA-like protein
VEKDKQWVTFFKASINQNGDSMKHTRQKGAFPHGSKSIEYPVRYTETFSSYLTGDSVLPSERSVG